jgi:two-component system, chemotaxis family, protein-glutamate methylesterase/glutaminase
MRDARVLVVDDSAAMRALFADVLDQAKNVQVVGTAANAAEARDQIDVLKPNVITLDVEMPGMSGIEFLEEIMTTKPMPVVMLSSLTQSGTDTSLKAYELGAVECFPKPLKATPEQFNKMVGKLGKIVLAAANSNVRDKPRSREQSAEGTPFQWNGHLVALSASMGGIDALTELLSRFPKNCPPTVIVLQTELALAQAFISRANGEFACAVRTAEDGAQLTQGSVYLAADPTKHVVVEAGTPARLRLLERDPVEGARPSANLLFASIARSGTPTVGAVLTGIGQDGAKGLKMLRDAGAQTFVQTPESATVGEAPAAAIAAGASEQSHAIEALAPAILARCSTT